MLKPLLALAKEATNWTDDQLGDLVAMPRSTVQAVIAGRTPEYLSEAQRRAIVEDVRGFLQDGAEILAEIEIRS
jgi:hypothetical protein